MRASLLLLSILLLSCSASAAEYGNYDPKRVFSFSESDGVKRVSLDRKYLDQILNDLSVHAISYPPQFDSLQDKERAIRDTKLLSGMLEVLANGQSADTELLVRYAGINSIGHNLDIQGSAAKADATYRKLLAAAPKSPRVNYQYGVFLAGIGKSAEAKPYLETAVDSGVVSALYGLGMVHLTLGDKQKALEYLERFQQRQPSQSTATLIDAIRNGKVETKRVTR